MPAALPSETFPRTKKHDYCNCGPIECTIGCQSDSPASGVRRCPSRSTHSVTSVPSGSSSTSPTNPSYEANTHSSFPFFQVNPSPARTGQRHATHPFMTGAQSTGSEMQTGALPARGAGPKRTRSDGSRYGSDCLQMPCSARTPSVPRLGREWSPRWAP